MNSYEGTLIELLRCIIDLNRLQASQDDIDAVLKRAEDLLEIGPEEFERSQNYEECSYCNKPKPNAKQERVSAGVYAGKMCDDCAYSRYRDHCGVDGTPQLTQADLSEDLEADDWGFGI